MICAAGWMAFGLLAVLFWAVVTAQDGPPDRPA